MRLWQWLRRWPTLILLGGVALVAAPLPAAEKTATTRDLQSEARLRRDVTFLASDECEGRGPTTRGIDLAAEYIAGEFRKAGLRPGGPDGSYFQPFTIPGAVLDAPARLALKGPLGQQIELKQGAHFQPMGLGKAGKFAASVVFAGYGITSTKPAYDDYAGLDVEDKVVVVLRGSPRAGGAGAAELRQHAPFVNKMRNAGRHHAAALLVVNDAEAGHGGDDLLDFNFTALGPSPATLPVLHVRRSVLATMLRAATTESLGAIEKGIDRDLKPHSLELPGWTVTLDVKMRRDRIPVKNVVGVLEGDGPLARETVVVGAHYDHLGYGGAGGSLARLSRPAIHHGADDNGSGTTALMELARRFGEVPGRQGRRLVFLAFSGEELGLLGSAHYVKQPLFPLADTVAMFNLDMVGRLTADGNTGKDKLLVEGNGTSKAFEDLVDRLGKMHGDFQMKKSSSLLPNSDHFSFYQKKVPVLFFWTGIHPDYHRPSDTADKINVRGMRRVVDVAEDAVGELATMPQRPGYEKVKVGGGVSPSRGPRLGIMPDYEEGGKGLAVGGVSDGGPAARAGLKKGDLITAINDRPVKNIETYMEAMSAQKKGSTITVAILRDGKKQEVKVKLD
jgi:hypothetical protein